MAKRKLISDPIRARLMDVIEDNLEFAREYTQMAQDIVDVLNALDATKEKLSIEDNVIRGAFKK